MTHGETWRKRNRPSLLYSLNHWNHYFIMLFCVFLSVSLISTMPHLVLTGIAPPVRSTNRPQRSLTCGLCLASWWSTWSVFPTIAAGGTSWTRWWTSLSGTDRTMPRGGRVLNDVSVLYLFYQQWFTLRWTLSVLFILCILRGQTMKASFCFCCQRLWTQGVDTALL